MPNYEAHLQDLAQEVGKTRQEAEFLATAREFRKAVEGRERADRTLLDLKNRLRKGDDTVTHHQTIAAEDDVRRWEELENDLRDQLTDGALTLPLN